MTKDVEQPDGYRLALSRDEMRNLGYRVVDLLVEHHDSLSQKPVTQRGDRQDLERLLREPMPVRGSAALDICFVAMGRLDGYYESLSIWDFAAAALIAKEAGASYGHFSPVPAAIDPQFYDQDIVIANSSIYPHLLALLQSVDVS